MLLVGVSTVRGGTGWKPMLPVGVSTVRGGTGWKPMLLVGVSTVQVGTGWKPMLLDAMLGLPRHPRMSPLPSSPHAVGGDPRHAGFPPARE